MRARPSLLAFLPALVAAAVLLQPSPGERGPLAARPASAAVGGGRVSFVASPGASILVHGTYPKIQSTCVLPVQPFLHARFPGTIEIGRDTDGTLFIIGVLPFEEYLQGIAEVPRTWPLEALKAQVVAARSYALANMSYPDPTGERLGYDLCATDACQVYRGLGVSAGPYGTRWVQAVEETAGQVLLSSGRPADTVYFSTSNGTTLGNEQVFGSAPLSYLRPVKENDDGASPVSHWTVVLPYGDVARFLRAAGAWGSQSVSSVSLSGENVLVAGGGASATISVTDFRNDINGWAHCLSPATYPTINTNGIRLPQTIPSKWFSAARGNGAVVLTGRGWGHGVGMVQWGAYGKAKRGMTYQDILAAYYGGLRPVSYDEPTEIRIGIATGLTSLQIKASGPVSVEGTSLTSGPWLVTGGKKLRVRPGAAPPTYITAGRIVAASTRGVAGRRIAATVSVPQLSVAKLLLNLPGKDVHFGPDLTVPAGTATIRGTLPDVATGTYNLQLEVTDGVDILRSAGRRLHITGRPPSPSPSPPSPSPSLTRSAVAVAPTHSAPILPVALGAGAIMALGVGLFLLRSVRRSARG